MQNTSTSRSTDFRRQKTITSKTPLTLYGRGFCASDGTPTTTGSPAGPQSNQNVWGFAAHFAQCGRRPGSCSRYEPDLRQAKWRGQGRMTSSCTLLSTVTASAQLGSKEFWNFLGSRRGKRLLCCSLSRTTTPALWVSGLVVRKEAYARDAEDEQLTFLWRLVDINDSATTTTSPRPGDASPTTTWTGSIFFACLSIISDVDPRSYNHVQGDDMRDNNPTFSCCLARVAIPCQVQQPVTAPPSGSKRSFFPLLFLPLLIEEQRWNLEQQISEV